MYCSQLYIFQALSKKYHLAWYIYSIFLVITFKLNYAYNKINVWTLSGKNLQYLRKTQFTRHNVGMAEFNKLD